MIVLNTASFSKNATHGPVHARLKTMTRKLVDILIVTGTAIDKQL